MWLLVRFTLASPVMSLLVLLRYCNSHINPKPFIIQMKHGANIVGWQDGTAAAECWVKCGYQWHFILGQLFVCIYTLLVVISLDHITSVQCLCVSNSITYFYMVWSIDPYIRRELTSAVIQAAFGSFYTKPPDGITTITQTGGQSVIALLFWQPSVMGLE